MERPEIPRKEIDRENINTNPCPASGFLGRGFVPYLFMDGVDIVKMYRILVMVRDGWTARDIAGCVGLAVSTVRRYLWKARRMDMLDGSGGLTARGSEFIEIMERILESLG